MYEDLESNKSMKTGFINKGMDTHKALVVKVFAWFAIEMSIFVGMIYWSIFLDSGISFFSSAALRITCGVFSILGLVGLLVIACIYEKKVERVPYNFLMTVAFTLCFSYLITWLVSGVDP